MNYSGIIYRIWAVGGAMVLLGIACLLVSGIRTKSFSKQCFLAGVLGALYGLGTAVYYIAQLVSPDVASFHGVFHEVYRNSRVAPPLPFTMEYSFYDENNDSRVFYLDVLSKKEIVPEGFLEDKEYVIYYETSTNIIVGVEMNG